MSDCDPSSAFVKWISASLCRHSRCLPSQKLKILPNQERDCTTLHNSTLSTLYIHPTLNDFTKLSTKISSISTLPRSLKTILSISATHNAPNQPSQGLALTRTPPQHRPCKSSSNMPHRPLNLHPGSPIRSRSRLRAVTTRTRHLALTLLLIPFNAS